MKSEGDEEEEIVRVVKPHNTKYYGNVNVHSGTLAKIARNHPEEFSRREQIYETLQEPTKVYQSKTNDRSLIVVNDKVKSSTSGSPLWVVVKRVTPDETILQSAYFNRTKNPGIELSGGQDEKID